MIMDAVLFMAKWQKKIHLQILYHFQNFDFSSRGPNALFWPPEELHVCDALGCRQDVHANKIKVNKRARVCTA